MKHFLRHLFIPHESNNHRAKILHHSSLFFLTLLLIGGSFLFSFGYQHDRSVLGISYSITADELLVITNQKRQENGLPPLSMDSSLAQAAQRKADDMFTKNYWAHIAPDGTTPWYFIRSSGYEYVYAGENLARGYTASSDVINAWMASPSHKENMLSSNYKDVGFAIKDGTLTGDDTVLVVEEFGSRTAEKPQSIAQPSSAPITPAPTSVAVLPVSNPVIPTPTAIVVTTTPTPVVSVSPLKTGQVEAYRNDPLISKPVAQKDIALAVVGIILSLLVVDIVVTRRKKVIRILSHNLDHIIFFAMLLLIILLLTRGGIL
jgi:hypothetical protein